MNLILNLNQRYATIDICMRTSRGRRYNNKQIGNKGNISDFVVIRLT